MVRAKWTNLNGLWDYAIVAKDAARPDAVRGQTAGALRRGIRALRREAPAHARAAALVPPHLHRRASRGHAPAAALRRGRLARRGLRQRQAVGTHEGGYDPFTFDITDALKPGAQQELVVAVWDPTDTGLQPRGKQVLNPNGIWYTAVSGIWQTVGWSPCPQPTSASSP